MAIGAPGRVMTPVAAVAIATPAAGRLEGLLRGTLYVTMLLSFVAFIEPSPHDGMMGILLVVALLAGVKLDRIHVPLILLLVLWNVGGLFSLLNVPTDSKAIQYAAISIYLSIAALLFAALLSRNTMPRLASLQSAYIAAAVISAVAGTIGYFHLIPPLYDVLTLYGRAIGFFKDPNVYGPYLIWPALFLTARLLIEGIKPRDTILLGIIMIGLMLSFSRGAWFHFALSAAITLALLFLTARTQAFRFRLIGLTMVGIVLAGGLIVVMLSIPQVGELFFERANAVNSYDIGDNGRFALQEFALGTVLQYFNGLGPYEFARIHGLQQHNVYLQSFLVYGWIGGISYLLMLAATLIVGFRNAIATTPWQAYAITAVAAFVGEVVEGMVIDTDHWRHFFLLLGMIWGLAAATQNFRRGAPLQPVAARVPV
jgi:hypothetical protein